LLVAVRKRPLLQHREGDDYDVLTAASARVLVCHEPKKDVKETLTCHHHEFRFDHVFDEDSSTAQIYDEAVAPSLLATLSQAPHSRANLTVFAYGQTGSGKTYTMEPIYAQTVAKALEACGERGLGMQLSVSFFEIYCAKVFDLLRDRAEVRTLEDARGEVQVENLAEIAVNSHEMAMQTIADGQRARVTHANAVHADSSRSHAVLQLLLRSTSEREHAPGAAAVAGYRSGELLAPRLLGKLVLVDLAGSERASETLSDDKATRHEGAEINKSLLALKECIRALGRGDKHKQFRGSKLTQVRRGWRVVAAVRIVRLDRFNSLGQIHVV
jgi:kinesin family protein 2/24